MTSSNLCLFLTGTNILGLILEDDDDDEGCLDAHETVNSVLDDKYSMDKLQIYRK